MFLLQIKVFFLIVLCELIFKHQAQQISCGVRRVREINLIVRGQSTKAHDWPWHATILHRNAIRKPPEYACGGSLISENFVLTAKHCTLARGNGRPLTSNAIVVQFGVENLYEIGPNVQEHRVLKVHTFKQFCCGELRNDIALLELRTVVQFNDFILPVCLPESDVMAGEMGTVVGFGLTELDEFTQTLRKAQLPVIETGKCLRSDRAGWGGMLDEGLFCAGYLNGTAVCNGDSGGGLVLRNNEIWQIVGIVAFSLARDDGNGLCKQDGFGGFTKVWNYLKWIRHVTGLKPPRDNVLNSDDLETSDLPSDCGRRTAETEFPWLALFYYQYSSSQWAYDFSGSLISKRYILLEVIRWTKFGNVLFRITFGNTKTEIILQSSYFSNSFFREIRGNQIIKNQFYNSHAIALVRLDPEVTFNEYVQPICLPASDATEPADLVTISRNDKDLFQHVSVALIDVNQCFEKCKTKMDFQENHNKTLCVETEQSVESGFPVGSIIQHGDCVKRFTLFGFKVYNWCKNLLMYSKITHFRKWIDETIKK